MAKQLLKAVCLFGILAHANAALELTATTFNDQVLNSGKNAFVKFLAPW